MVDDLRYGKAVQPSETEKDKETAFVRVRYKLPGEKKSQLIQQKVVKTVPLNKVSRDVKFSIAVAGFGQKLKNSKFVEWDLKDIRSFAQKLLGEDEYGYRSDFISLLKKAEALLKPKML